MNLLSSFIRGLGCVVFLIWGDVSATSAPSTPLKPATIITSGWLDPSGAATVHNVEKLAKWEPFTGWKSWGFGPESIWLRVKVPAGRSANEPPQILIVHPPFLDHVTFHDPATGALQLAGDFWPPKKDQLEIGLITFEVAARTQDREVLVKIETTGGRAVHLSLLPWAEAQMVARRTEWVSGGVLILTLIFSFWSMIQWWLTRDPLMRAFAVNQVLVLFWGFVQLGFARITFGDLFAPSVLTQLNSILGALMISAAMWFFAKLLAEYSPHSWMLRVLEASRWLLLCMVGLNFVEPRHLMLQCLNTLTPFLFVWLILIVWTSNPGKNKPPIPKAVLTAYLCFFALINSIPVLGFLGVIPETDLLFFGHMSSMVANGLIMFFILLVLQHRFKQQHESMAMQLTMQEQRTRLDQQHMDDQRKLLAMLAHEMKTPLANLRIWMEAGPKGRPAMQRAIHDMNLVIERCMQTGQLSDQHLQPHNEWLDAAALTQTVLTSSRQPERVALHLPTNDCVLHVDAQMLSIVLSNLLENAFKYSAPETPIFFQLEAQACAQGTPGMLWQIENSVGDAGLPDNDKVFSKYYRSQHAKRQSGSGLGLFLVKSLLTLMQGRVNYTALSGSVRFEVWLPSEPTQTRPRA